MTPMLAKILSLIVYLLIGLFQVRNFIKYRKTNGANYTRICLFFINCFLITHNIRLMLGYTEGYFFASMSLAWFALQFQDWIYGIVPWVTDKLKTIKNPFR
jgi:hypothetical protein